MLWVLSKEKSSGVRYTLPQAMKNVLQQLAKKLKKEWVIPTITKIISLSSLFRYWFRYDCKFSFLGIN